MKKALFTISTVVSGIASAFAQTTIIIGDAARQGQVNGSAILQLIGLTQEILGRLFPIAFTLAVLSFFWFLITFIWKGKENPEKQQESLKGMGLSILALFVMLSIYGIIGLIGSIFGVNQGGNIPVPRVPGSA